jgi:hypothetical protein
MNSCHMTGMTGQSSARGAWWKPSVYQATMSMFSMGRFALVQMAKLQFGAEVANLFNRRNYASPNMQLDSDGFGTISSLQTAEGAGPRSVQLTARITF